MSLLIVICALSLFIQIPVVHQREPSNQEPAFRSQDQAPPWPPLSLLGEGSQDEHLASCLLGHLEGRGTCRIAELLLKVLGFHAALFILEEELNSHKVWSLLLLQKVF